MNNWKLFAPGIVLIAVLGLVGIRYITLRSHLIQKNGASLSKILAERQHQIISFIDAQKDNLGVLATNKNLVALSAALDKTFVPGVVGDAKNTPANYQELEKKLDLILNQENSTYRFKDIFLVRLDGMIFYTLKADLLSANLADVRGQATGLGASWDRARMALTPDVSAFAIDPFLNASALFIVRPFFDAGQLRGFIGINIDESLLYAIIQNYEGLGSTGDLFVTKSIGDRVIFVAPSRLYAHVAFKKITDPSREENTPTRFATAGKTGYGYLVDAYNVGVIAAWTFIPQLDVGASMGIQYHEVARPIFWYKIVFMILLGLLILWALFMFLKLHHTRLMLHLQHAVVSIHFLKLLLWISFVGITGWAGLLFVKRYYEYRTVVNTTVANTESKIHGEVELARQYITEVEKIAAMMAQDLHEGRLAKEDIGLRITRDVKELSDIESIMVAFEPFAYNPQQRLYGIEAKKVDGRTTSSEISYDYIVPDSSKTHYRDWYNKTIKEGAHWSEPFYDATTKMSHIMYLLPFYLGSSAEPAGVIAIQYSLQKIIEAIRKIEIGKTGYVMLMNDQEMLLYHPLEQYLKDKATFFDVARENNNIALKDIAQTMLKSNQGVRAYTEPITHTTYWIVYEKVPDIHWIVAGVFSNESLPLPLDDFHEELVLAIVALVIALLIGAMLLAEIWIGLEGLRRWAIFSCIILGGSILIFWNITWRALYFPRESVVVVRDQAGLDKYMELLEIEAGQRNEEPPISLPTGLFLHNLTFPTSNKVSLAGYWWQKIPPRDKKISTGILFPEASETTVKEIFNKEERRHETVGWNISAQFAQKHRYSFFPFDKVHVDIVMSSTDFENNVALTPDFSGYKSYDVDPLPGITNQISIPGYSLERSYFSFSVIPPADEVGLDALRKVTDKVQLHYNLILKRKLINPFIMFFLPLLVILFSIYAIFLLSQRGTTHFDAFRSLTAYTGLFFSLVILHQTLRNQVQAGELLYIEYFFFFAYITILLLVFHALIRRAHPTIRQATEKMAPYLRLLFWPLQLALWFAVTMFTFYSLR